MKISLKKLKVREIKCERTDIAKIFKFYRIFAIINREVEKRKEGFCNKIVI